MRKLVLLFMSWLCLLCAVTAFADYVQKLPTTRGGTGSAAQSPSVAVTTDALGNIVSTTATTATEIGYVHGLIGPVQIQIAGLATTTLNNLGVTAINAALLPGASGTISVGSAALPFKDMFFTDVKDLLGAVSIDPLNRVLENGSAASILDFSGASAKVPSLAIKGSTSGIVTLQTSATPTTHSVQIPDVVCAAGQYWADSGTGVMSCTSLPSSNISVVNGGDTNYAILTGDRHVRSGTVLTAARTYTLPVCNSSNIGERHEVKNLPSQTFSLTLAGNGSDLVDGAATYALAPGNSVPVVCAAFVTAGTWDIE